MMVSFIDRSLRLPLGLAFLLATGVIGARLLVQRDPGYRNYGENCGICHHGGTGQEGETPPLFGRLGPIAQTENGRDYLMAVLLNGLNGPITVRGQHYNYSMPSFRRLDDAAIAQILNFAAGGGRSDAPIVFTPADIAKARTHTLASWQVHDMRAALEARQTLP